MAKFKFYGPLKVYVSVEIEAEDMEDARHKTEEINLREVVGDGSCARGLHLEGPFIPESVDWHTTDCYPELDPDEEE